MPFTHDKELEAAAIARKFKDSFAAKNPGHAIGNDARIWNNPRWMFDNPIHGKPVLVGVHIGGTPAVVGSAYAGPDENWHRCLRTLSNPDAPCNEWVCGEWDDKGTKAQDKIRCVFNALFGPGRGREVLLGTPSFDACPVRVAEEHRIPPEMWECSKEWFYSVLEHLRPSLIICNRNYEPGNGKSAWGALLDNPRYDIRLKRRTLIRWPGYLKSAEITAGALSGTEVIGFPQLTRWGNECLWSKLEKLGTKLDLR